MIREKTDRYFPFYWTHNTFAEGGGKIHISHGTSTRALCGFDRETHLCNEVFLEDSPFDTLEDYISQPDPDKCICQRCKRIMTKILNSQK